MNKVLTFCKTHGYHLLGSRADDLSTTPIISTAGHIDIGVLTLIENEKLFAGWEHSSFRAYLAAFKGKWIGFVETYDDTPMMKLQANNLPELKDKILTKFTTNESTLPGK